MSTVAKENTLLASQQIVFEDQTIRKSKMRSLQSRNVRIYHRRTSIRLEPEMWDALNEIVRRENCALHQLCGVIYDLKAPIISFTAALRVFLMEYYRSSESGKPRVIQVQQRLKEFKKRSVKDKDA